MEILGIIGVFIGIVLIIWFSVKGLHIIIAAPLSALVVILANQMDIFWVFGWSREFVYDSFGWVLD